jgi:hypothetical protein
LQVAMHSPGDSEPSGSGAHWPAVVLQLYITGVGAGVGTGVGFGVGTGVGGDDLQVAMQSTGDSGPLGSSLHWPDVVSQLYVGTGVGGTGVGFGVGFGFGMHVANPVLPPAVHCSEFCNELSGVVTGMRR